MEESSNNKIWLEKLSSGDDVINNEKTIDILEFEHRKIELENAEINRDIKKEELEQKKVITHNLKKESEDRVKFSRWIFGLICAFLVVVIGVITACGCSQLKLDSGVQIALLTTSCANVIAIFLIVVKYLFRTKE